MGSLGTGSSPVLWVASAFAEANLGIVGEVAATKWGSWKNQFGQQRRP
jgi:hypothetical protein